MAVLQILAPDLAGVDELVFYMGRSGGPAEFARALELREELVPERRLAGVVDRVLARGYEWGEGNGT